MQIIISENSYRKFAFEVFKYLYINHNLIFEDMIDITNTRPLLDYGISQIKGVFVEKSSASLLDKHNEPSYTFHLWGKEWLFEGSWRSQKNNTTNNQCITALIDMINIKFPQYEVLNTGGTSYVLVERPIASLMNFIRIDYSYLSSGTINPGYFSLTSTILAATSNASFLSLLDRIPVYIVDSRFMQEYFEKGDKHWEIPRILTRLLQLLKDILDILQENEDAEKLPEKLNKTREVIEELKKIKVYCKLILGIEGFLNCIEDSINRNGIPATIRYKNFVQPLIGIIDDFPKSTVSTEYLGVYCPEWERNEFHEKAIFICWERICDYADRGHAIDLLTKVTIHEFCHAYLDVIAGSGRASKDIYHWMEESMANVLTLKVIENYTTKHPSTVQLLKYAKGFMNKQPDAYASAVRLWENGICDYDLWAWNKDKCVAANSINNWHKEMSASWKTITNDRIRELWNEVKQEILGI